MKEIEERREGGREGRRRRGGRRTEERKGGGLENKCRNRWVAYEVTRCHS